MAVNKNFIQNRAVQTIIIILGVVLIINLCRDIRRLLGASGQIKLAEEKVEELEKENQQYKGKKEYYQSSDFIEEEARNKLNMARPEETIVILPPNQAQNLGSGQASKEDLPNWQKWWKLFF